MRLQTKFNLVFAAVYSVGLVAVGTFAHTALQRSAREEVSRQAGLLMANALSVRRYTADQVRPLLDEQMHDRFVKQSVPSYSAHQTFGYFREKYPDYSYKEATLNPSNPKDRASDWEEVIINRFRQNPQLGEDTGERMSQDGLTMYLSRPIRVADRSCLTCHGDPKDAPPTVLKVYGNQNGFGWKMNEVVGAQVLSVPMSVPIKIANRGFRNLMTILVLVFAATMVLLNVMLRYIVVQPVTRLSAVADEISRGNVESEDLPVTGKDEIATLAGSFNRMQRSLKYAMKMLEE